VANRPQNNVKCKTVEKPLQRLHRQFSLTKNMKIDKNKLLLLLIAGTNQYDRKYDKTLSMHILNTAWNLPSRLLQEPNYDEMSYAIDILDFEYKVFDSTGEKYPTWVNKYFEWKSGSKK